MSFECYKLCLSLLCFLIPYTLGQSYKRDEIIFHYNNTYKYDVLYIVNVDKNTEYIMEFAGDLRAYDTPARVTVASDFANRTYPLFITARQQKGVFSWQLPMLVQTPVMQEQFSNISRTLCPHNNLFAHDEDSCEISSINTPIVHLTSSSPDPIQVSIKVETVQDFYIKINTTTNLTSTPSQPKYYFYPFDQGPKMDLKNQHLKRKYMCNEQLTLMEDNQLNLHHQLIEDDQLDFIGGDQLKSSSYYLRSNFLKTTGWLYKPKSVILMIESDDDICAVVSIQNFSCPVFDNERDILYDGYYLTMTRRGGITLTQDNFPLGFYIVFIVKTTDDDCTLTNTNATVPSKREKSFRLRIIQTVSYQEYLIGAGVVLAYFLSFYVAFITAVVCRRKRQISDEVRVPSSDSDVPISIPADNADVSTPRRRRVVPVDMAASVESTSQYVGHGDCSVNAELSSSSDTESDISTLDDAGTDKDVLLAARLCVANLARCRPRVLSARSKLYLWNVLTVAVFYTLPVIQLVVTYQRLLNQSGNQDLCYFNFLCAHPLLQLSDFNHVYSNLGYVLLGVLFLIQVWRKHKHHEAKTEQEKELGIPQHFGLLYAMGIALVSEGLLSAAYHVCPNSMNFQFDTSFMYVTAVLCMVKIYQSRHPDINARAHATFGVLALIIFIGLVGVLNANLYFWVVFTVMHLVTCLVMTFQIYYLGRFRLDAGTVYRAARTLITSPLHAVTPTHCGRGVMLLIANLCNWAIAAYGVAQHSRDFASHLLLVLMSNLFLYTLFYIIMKLLHRESIRWYSWIFIVITYTIWFSSSYFYLDQSTNWALTPAQSRLANRQCAWLQLYDSHDMWHFMSSSAMFFSFNMYLTIDDNLNKVPRTSIMVF